MRSRITSYNVCYTKLLRDAWWGASVPMPDGSAGFLVAERSLPYSMIVDQEGRRFTNESASYIRNNFV